MEDHSKSKAYLSNLIMRQQEDSTETRKRMPQQLPESWTIKLFTKFQVIYGHKWLSVIDSDELYALALEEWSERLHGLTGDDIKHGLSSLTSEWPPSPHEFRDLCVGDKEHNTKAYRLFDKSKALELKADKELANKSMMEIKRLLSN